MYTTPDGVTKVDVTFEEDTVWLTQEQMAELFQKAKSTINYHIQQVYEDGELSRDATMRKFENSEFSTKPLNFYNLDMVISVGYRVRSQCGGAGVYNVRGELAHAKSLCYPVRRVNQSHYANARKSVILSSCKASGAMLVCGNRKKS